MRSRNTENKLFAIYFLFYYFGGCIRAIIFQLAVKIVGLNFLTFSLESLVDLLTCNLVKALDTFVCTRFFCLNPSLCKDLNKFNIYYRERGGGRYQWRRSFGSSPLTTGKDEAANQSASSSGLQPNGTEADWPALQANYTYLMSCDLIESCRSLNGEMSWDNGDLEHLRQANALQETRTAQSPSIAVGCQTDAEISIPGMR